MNPKLLNFFNTFYQPSKVLKTSSLKITQKLWYNQQQLQKELDPEDSTYSNSGSGSLSSSELKFASVESWQPSCESTSGGLSPILFLLSTSRCDGSCSPFSFGFAKRCWSCFNLVTLYLFQNSTTTINFKNSQKVVVRYILNKNTTFVKQDGYLVFKSNFFQVLESLSFLVFFI